MRIPITLTLVLLFTSLVQAQDTVTCAKKVMPAVAGVRFGAKIIGTAFVVHPDGLLATSAHVVGGKDTKVLVRLTGIAEFECTVRVLRLDKDLAILKTTLPPPLPLPCVVIPVLDTAVVGTPVLAFGFPLGQGLSVTKGIVSGLGRIVSMPTGTVLTGVIQTDAPISFGNSGGPLCALDGTLVGVMCAYHSGGHGIGFAIPASDVRTVLLEGKVQ